MNKIAILLAIYFYSGFSFSEQDYFVLDTLHLESGEKIYPCRIGYRTLGQLNPEHTNVVLFPTWFGGTSRDIESLILNNNFIDTTRWYIIIVDALGNGISESPSTYYQEFPDISILDMVTSQYLLVNKRFKLEKVYAIVGGSMGSLQVFKWLVTYPEFMEKAIPYVASPNFTSYGLLYLNTQKDIIESGKEYNLPDQVINRQLRKVQALLSRTPEYIVKNISREETDKYLNTFNVDNPFFTVENWYSQLNAMYEYSIFNEDINISKAVETVKADVFIIVSSTDHIVNPIPAIKLANNAGWQLLVLENDCGHLAIGCEMEKCVSFIAEFLNK